MFVNEPLDLELTEIMSGLSCVAANILHVFGVSPPDPGDWRWVDKEIERSSVEFASPARICRLLADQGLRVYVAGESDPSRVVSEGLSYLQEYYAEMWDNAWDEWWIPENIEKAKDDARVYLSLEADGIPMDSRPVSAADVKSLVERGFVVVVAVRNGRSEQCQWLLVLEYANDVFKAYNPSSDGSSLFDCSYAMLSCGMIVSEGLIAVQNRF